jgi:hypothetical protein
MPPLLLFLAGVAAGAGAAVLVPALAPEASRNLRPVLRAGLKLAIAAGTAARAAAAEAAETVEDLYAEAQAELAEATQPPQPPAPAARARRATRARAERRRAKGQAPADA